jgi:hypothetical protein
VAAADITPSRLWRNTRENARMTLGRSRSLQVALALGCALNCAGCAEDDIHFGSGYAIVPIQTVTVAGAHYVIQDRRDVGRLTITPTLESKGKLGAMTASVRKYFAPDPDAPNGSTGVSFYDPLMHYFAQNKRTCRLIRGNPLIEPQWEFVYSCRPGDDASAITWQSSGFSNAPRSPNR